MSRDSFIRGIISGIAYESKHPEFPDGDWVLGEQLGQQFKAEAMKAYDRRRNGNTPGTGHTPSNAARSGAS